MKVLLIGSGGREHALAWALSASPLLTKLYCAPGNAGIAQVAECVPIAAMDFDKLVGFAKEKKIDFVIIAPDNPLVGGLWDRFEAEGIRASGPSGKGAILEGSKGFVKDLCREIGIPTAAYQRFRDAASAKAFADTLGLPAVIKADGLALGKGVIIAETKADAGKAIDFMFEGGFGESGSEVVVEEFMQGEEASFFALSDGETAIPLAGAQDHKRAFDGDKGPNTGGMGAYSPAPVMTDAMVARTMDEIIRPTLRAMKAKGMPYKGVLFAGLMISPDGPKLIEYNVRFGDPETQVLMLRMMSDLVPALMAAVDGELKHFDLRWYPQSALTVVMAAKGYPGDYVKGSVIAGLDEAAKTEGVEIFHAGTRSDGGRILANGGRVLNVTAMGDTVGQAQRRAYQAIDKIQWPEGFCRRDIGWQAIKREQG
jgi:phosphoribosylamine--glycine ligase